jgi:hypothetical protein
MVRLTTFAVLFGLAACGGESAAPWLHGGSSGNNTGGAGGGLGGMTGLGGVAGGQGGGGGNNAGGHTGLGGGAGGTTSDGGTDTPPGYINGTPCTSGTQCSSGICAAEGVCCNMACAGTCMTCVGTTVGMCLPVQKGMDPKNECGMEDPSTCGKTGNCSGSGACEYYGSSTQCDSNPSCNGAASAVITNRVCNGSGSCVPGAQSDCKGYLCASAMCKSTCASDADCTPNAFCAAGACVLTPANLVGNGDLETGTLTGWAYFPSGTPILSNASSGGIAHGGQYSVGTTVRTQYYAGPSYVMSSGISQGKYNISAWGTQLTPSSQAAQPGTQLILQFATNCRSTQNYLTVTSSGNFQPNSVDPGVWSYFSGTVDTNVGASGAPSADCQLSATPPGMVRNVNIYLNQYDQTMMGTPLKPDLYMDDLSVTVTDGHNLSNNPGFEIGTTDGWTFNGSGTLAVSTVNFNTGSYGLGLTGRGSPTSGQKLNLPTGAVRYKLLFNVFHTGSTSHDLSLQGTYTCIGGTVTTFTSPIVTKTIAPTTWDQLSGIATFPPANAPAGCKMSQASVYIMQEGSACGTGTGQVECPDIFIDDVSVTLQ